MTGAVLNRGGNQPVPATSCSAASAISVFFKAAIRSAASSDTASRTASPIRALVTRPR